jgi:hypothetical protein
MKNTFVIKLIKRNKFSVNTYEIVLVKRGQILKHLGHCYYDAYKNLYISVSVKNLKKWLVLGAIPTFNAFFLLKNFLKFL